MQPDGLSSMGRMRYPVIGLGFAACLAAPLACAEGAAGAACAKLAEVRQVIPLSTGVYTERAQVAVPNQLEVRFYLDEQKYADCLMRHGVFPDAQRAAYFTRLEECRNQRRVGRALIGTGAAPRLVGGAASDLDACLRGAPSTPEVEVEFGPAEAMP